MPVLPRAIVLLGAQRFDPTLGDAVSELGVKGKIATITAGWQERETEDDDLVEHLSGNCVNLRLHARADEVFKADPELHKEHRQRQALLRHRQDFYRVRLEHLLDTEHVISHRAAPDEILGEELTASMEAIRELDAKHLARCTRDRAEWEERVRPHERAAVQTQRQEIANIVRQCEAIAIAGGHVASLMNRLSLFGIDQLAHNKVIFAWCAGAMALAERLVLFHDSPPQGPGAAEVLDAGLGLAKNVVVLPQPDFRLRLDDQERVAVYARRFAPALCMAMPACSRVTWIDGHPEAPVGVLELRADGSHGAVSVRAHKRGRRGQS
jgi:hypothetical protein